MYFELTETGWEWATNNLDAEVSTSSTAAGPILQAVMTMLKMHLQRCGTGLADFIEPSGQPADAEEESETTTATASVESTAPTSLDQRILSAYATLSKGEYGVRIYLAALRNELNGTPRDILDNELRQMERDGRLTFYPLDNPQEIRPEDQAASLPNSVGDPRHILYTNERPAN
ncbi:MAG: hypothetical protein ACKVHE_12085 [Planctomycetales bacterium]|jgi:hypothetical protein